MPDTEAAPLPTDVATLQAMVLAHAAEFAEVRTARQEQDGALAAARAGIIEQRFEIEALKARLAKLLRVTFGRSSEKLRDQVEQLELTLADIDEMLAETIPPDAPHDTETAVPTAKRAASAARGVATRYRHPRCSLLLPSLWRCPAAVRRGRDGNPGYVRDRFASFDMFAPSCPAGPARRLPRRRRQACPFAAVARGPACSPMCWWRNTAIICHCTGRPKSTPARISISVGRRWPTWSVRSRSWSAPWSMPWPGT